MHMSYQPDDNLPNDLRSLDFELMATFAAERIALPAGVTAGVMARLPMAATSLTRFARMISAVILLGAVGLMALFGQWLVFWTNWWDPRDMILASLGGLIAMMALLVAFSLPRTAWWRWHRQVAEHSNAWWQRRDAIWLLAHRLTAVVLMIVAAVVVNA